ncbi:MAG TPA: alpha/beta fold hydrolase [Chryseolinea sp.]|nr:alpha/beta fold hydrolase [Chryseolinea sp.]
MYGEIGTDSMTKEILFVHSAGPQGHHEGSDYLVRYLIDALGPGYRIWLPDMPDPENPHYVNWKARLKKEFASIEDEVILVGHSLGASVLLKYLSEERLQQRVAGLFLIGAVYWGKKDWEVKEYVLKRNFSSKLPSMGRIFLYHSSDDEVVPISHVRYFANELPKATVREFEHRGHLFGRGLPELVEDIKGL